MNEVEFFEVMLPREIALCIFSFLDVTDLLTCAQVIHYTAVSCYCLIVLQVCRGWHQISADGMLWRQLARRLQLVLPVVDDDDDDWRGAFLEQCE